MPKGKGTRVSAAQQAQKDRQVLDLRAAGATLQEIADVHFSGHRANAHRALTRIMEAHVADGVDTLRTVENHRLDRMQQAHWVSALQGNQGATKVVLSIMERRARMNGLDTQQDTLGGGNITVVLDPSVGTGGGMAEPELIVDAPLGTPGE